MDEKKGRKRYRRIRSRQGKNYKFSDKIHPLKGILAFLFALFGILTFLATSYLSCQSKGNLGVMAGLFGVIALLLSIAGVILSILALRQKEIHYRFPVIGGILCAVLLIGYIAMYALGAIL